MRFWTPAIAVALLLLWPVQTAAQPVIVGMVTDTGNDTLIEGRPGCIQFYVDANGNNVAGATWLFEVNFSAGNIIGPVSEGAEVNPTPAATGVFESISWASFYGNGTDPDTLLYGFIDFGGPLWDFSIMWSICFTPTGTGPITFDTIRFPGIQMSFPHDLGGDLPFDWRGDGKEITVVEPVVIADVLTNTGNDTLYAGLPGCIEFHVDANGNRVAAATWTFEVVFSEGNIIGPLGAGVNVHPGPAALNPVFESIAWNAAYGNGSNPDTIYYSFIDFGGPLWDFADVMWSICFTPTGHGTIAFDSVQLIGGAFGFVDDLANSLPSDWRGDGKDITVVDCPAGNLVNGDTNFDRVVNAVDIIYLVGHTFKSGPEPIIWNLGDVNCDEVITADDIMHLIGYVFKSGSEPCDVCSTL